MTHFVEGELAVICSDEDACGMRMARKSSWEFEFFGDSWGAIASNIVFLPSEAVVIIAKDIGYDLGMQQKSEFVVVIYDGMYCNVYRRHLRRIDE